MSSSISCRSGFLIRRAYVGWIAVASAGVLAAALCGGCPGSVDAENAALLRVVAGESTAVATSDDVGNGNEEIELGDCPESWPNVFFAVDAPSAPGDLLVRAYAYTIDGTPLPNGLYHWSFDNEIKSGGMATHADVRHTFSTGGVHIVRLTIALLGCTAPVSCVAPSGNVEFGATVTIQPTIAGTVADSAGRPLAGATVTADGVALVATADSEGRFVLSVPVGWSGNIVPSAAGYTFGPPTRSFGPTNSDVAGQTFVATAEAGSDGVSRILGDMNCDGTLNCGDVNPFVIALSQPAQYAVAYPGCPISNGDINGDGQMEFGDINPFVALMGELVPPDPQDQAVQTSEDTPVDIVLTATDTYRLALRYVIVSLPASGTLVDSGNQSVIGAAQLPYTLTSNGHIVAYRPNVQYSGSDVFTFLVNNELQDSEVATVSITITALNDPPTAYAQSVSVDEDVTKIITLSGTDPDGDSLAYAVVGLPAHGTLKDGATNQVIGASQLPYTLASGGRQVKYTNAMAYVCGADSFAFRVNDGASNSPAATVGITVVYGNHPPVADSQDVAVEAGVPKPITLTATDPHYDALTFSVEVPPAHGTLSGAPPNVTYTPIPGYVGSDSFTFTASDGCGESAPASADIVVGSSGWVTPLGIPTPPFGVNEAHTMYAGQQWNYGSGLEPYRNAGNGPYTHYVDTSHAQSTDTSNTYGSPSKPRKTVPQNLPAGSVVEIHGGPYTYTVGGVIPLGGSGTAAQPIFIRGVAASGRVRFSKPIEITGQYTIVESIDVNTWSTSNDTGVSIEGRQHVALRHCEVRNGPDATTCAIWMGGSSSAKAQYVVIYDNLIHDNGDWQATYDQDHHGIGISGYAQDIWVVDNEMYHNSGDGIQINGSNATTHHIYVGRNTSWQNKQCGFWCKYASDVIFTQNTAYSHVPSDSSPGAGLGWQYGPDRIWFIFNHSYNNTDGITGPSANSSGEPAYIVGNVIHDCSELGINLWNNRSVYVLNNTITRCGEGISISGSTAIYVVNNIISQMTASSYTHLVVDGGMATNSRAQYNLFYQSGGAARIDWSSATHWNVATFQAQISTAVGNKESNPQFVNATANDFHLPAASPAVNAGTAAGYAQQVYSEYLTRYGKSLAVDYDGNPRPVGAGYDMGAFER